MWTALADVVLSCVRPGYVIGLLLACVLWRLYSVQSTEHVWNLAHQEKRFCLHNSSLWESLSNQLSLPTSLSDVTVALGQLLLFLIYSFKMGRIAKEVWGQTLCFIGLIGLCLTCGLPMWRTTYFIGANIVTGQIVWDGLWMNCVMQSTGQMQCKIQSSVMSLTQDLQAAQALIVIAILIAFAGILMTFIGAQCTSCLKNESTMAKLVICGGVLCIVAAVVCLIPVCWSAAFTITDYSNVLVPTSQKREIGGSVYIGWGTSFVLLLGGIILCTSCPPNEMQQNNPNTYPYQGPFMGPAGHYMPPKTYPPSVTYSGTYVPGKPYVAPSTYSAVPRQYM